MSDKTWYPGCVTRRLLSAPPAKKLKEIPRVQALFDNQVPLQSVSAKQVHERHQIDIVDLQKLQEKHGNKYY